MKLSATVLISVSALMLSACSGQLAPRFSGPSAPVEIAPGHSVLFTDSGHRGLHVFHGPPDPMRYRVCIEPSPDTAAGMRENFGVGAFNTTARRDRGQYGGMQVGTDGPALSLDSTRTQTVITRDLAVELFRDTLAQACIAHAQGVISASEYASFLRAATGGALSMVAMGEIAGRAGSTQHDEAIAEKVSNLAQMALFGLLITDDGQQENVSSLISRIADLKAEALEVQIELMRGRAGEDR